MLRSSKNELLIVTLVSYLTNQPVFYWRCKLSFDSKQAEAALSINITAGSLGNDVSQVI